MEGKIAAEDVWKCLEVKPAHRSQDKNDMMSDAMKQLGWERKKIRTGGGRRPYHYTRGPEPHQLIAVEVLDLKDGSPPTPVALYASAPRKY